MRRTRDRNINRYRVVAGRFADFPIDMLRYAESWPETEEDSAKITRTLQSDLYPDPPKGAKVEITLRTNISLLSFDTAAKRWASFGWGVQVQREDGSWVGYAAFWGLAA